MKNSNEVTSVTTVGHLKDILKDLDDQDQVCIETCDEHGNVQDLYLLYVDVIEGIELTDRTKIREVRFCQIPHN